VSASLTSQRRHHEGDDVRHSRHKRRRKEGGATLETPALSYCRRTDLFEVAQATLEELSALYRDCPGTPSPIRLAVDTGFTLVVGSRLTHLTPRKWTNHLSACVSASGAVGRIRPTRPKGPSTFPQPDGSSLLLRAVPVVAASRAVPHRAASATLRGLGSP
jgi:hypothetical protein